MHLPRKSLVGLIVIAALFGATTAPAAGMSGAATGLGHAPIIHIATIPAGIRQRRRRRGARARSIAWRAVRRMGGVRRMVRIRRETLQPRVPPHESLARGPPRTDSRRCRNGAAMRRPAFAFSPIPRSTDVAQSHVAGHRAADPTGSTEASLERLYRVFVPSAQPHTRQMAGLRPCA
jgi:hypothetical protein